MKTAAADSRLIFSDLYVSIKCKEILKGVSGTAKSGELFAVIGPTGMEIQYRAQKVDLCDKNNLQIN